MLGRLCYMRQERRVAVTWHVRDIARARLNEYLTGLLGRSPGEDEVNAAVAFLAKYGRVPDQQELQLTLRARLQPGASAE